MPPRLTRSSGAIIATAGISPEPFRFELKNRAKCKSPADSGRGLFFQIPHVFLPELFSFYLILS
jgi:hypothetical protein